MPGPWNTSNPPLRPGLAANFVAAATAAVDGGTGGRALIVGVSNYGPSDKPYLVRSQGEYDALFGNQAASTLRNGVLDALDGFDDGGAGEVLAMRAVSGGTAPVKATLVLSDSVPVTAITLTAKYAGTRANNWTVVVRANPTNGANKDLILYESGVELERFENVLSGFNNNFVTAINASSLYMVATILGASSRALANIVGTIGGTGGFGTGGGGVAGTDGAALVVGDIGTALNLCSGYDFDCAALAELSTTTFQDTAVAWILAYNKTGRRGFLCIGGAASETQATAAAKATTYDDFGSSPSYNTYETAAREVIIVTTDLLRLSDNVAIPSCKLSSRMAGYVANCGIKRSIVNGKLTGYQVTNPYTAIAYEAAQAQGIVPLSNDTINRVQIESGNTAMITFTTAADTLRPTAHKKIENVAVDHVVEEGFLQVLKDPYVAQLRNSVTGRQQIASSAVQYLRTLEKLQVLAPGLSTVDLDTRYVQTGNATFLLVFYAYQDTIERILLNVRVR